ncbi:MAG TPA: peroxiredoxin-like family protein [Tepidisphaeraceae bacterium]|jgi:peroxiredoxin|nr:peroxiredoxin-like family protein [Tepidisphaeraceae bacterium]
MKKALLLSVALLSVAASVVKADDAANQPTTRPVEIQLNGMAAGFSQKMPEANKTLEAGIAEIAATGIVEKAPKVGDKAELFELPDATGKTVKLEDLLKNGPVVLSWYRGGWCPYCNISLHGLVDAEPKIRELGATLVAITPETPDNASKTIKADAIPFTVLSDQGNKVADKYRIAYKVPHATLERMKSSKLDLTDRNGDDSGTLPLAATFVVDRHGIIRWEFVSADYRKRAEPADVLQALRELKK